MEPKKFIVQKGGAKAATKKGSKPAVEPISPKLETIVGSDVCALPNSSESYNFKRSSLAQVVLAVVAGLVGIYLAQSVFIVLFVSILLAFVLTPLTDFFQKLRLPRSVAALLSLLIFVGAVGALGRISYSRAVDFSKEFPKYSGELRKVFTKVTGPARSLEQTTAGIIPPTNDKHVTVVRQQTDWTDHFTQSLGTATEFLFSVSFVPFLAYFMLTWREHVRSCAVLLFDREHRNTAYAAMGEISEMIRSFIVGNLLIGLVLGICSSIAFAFLHVPYFYFVGFISGALSLVPYLGVLLALLPPILSGIGQIGSEDIALILAVVFGLHLLALNVLYPKLLGPRLQLNPLAVTVGLLFWGWIWGAMGLILAIPIMAALKIVSDRVGPLNAVGLLLGE